MEWAVATEVEMVAGTEVVAVVEAAMGEEATVEERVVVAMAAATEEPRSPHQHSSAPHA